MAAEVVHLPSPTELSDVLNAALAKNLKIAAVVGVTQDGRFVIMSSRQNVAQTVLMLEAAKQSLVTMAFAG